MLEALATGVPVAGYPVQGPLDIIGTEGRGPHGTLDRAIGCLKPDLAEAINGALPLDRADAANYGAQFCWDRCTDQFVNGITKAGHSDALAA
jgi:glycosyltransferase involved in cell wall biosynthesis